ncbi:MAG: hypothetical protein JWR19_4199 [Pedosphaera sp.]|nr:hypothetical protein [Pedosphaera sp.]
MTRAEALRRERDGVRAAVFPPHRPRRRPRRRPRSHFSPFVLFVLFVVRIPFRQLGTPNAEHSCCSSWRFNHIPKPLDVARVARVAQLFSKKTPTTPFVHAAFTVFWNSRTKICPRRTDHSAPFRGSADWQSAVSRAGSPHTVRHGITLHHILAGQLERRRIFPSQFPKSPNFALQIRNQSQRD